jgi:hypothetical protein
MASTGVPDEDSNAGVESMDPMECPPSPTGTSVSNQDGEFVSFDKAGVTGDSVCTLHGAACILQLPDITVVLVCRCEWCLGSLILVYGAS